MNRAPMQAPSAHALIDGDEATRLALRSLVDLYAARDPRGVSAADCARHVGCSEQQFARILEGTRYLHPGQIAKLPERAFDAVMGAIRNARGEKPAHLEETACMAFMASAGAAVAEIAKALADGDVDASERPKLRAEITRVASGCASALRAMDAAEGSGARACS